MLRVAVCDDERIIREKIVHSLNEYSRLRNVDIVCDQFETGHDFLCSKNNYQIVLLDYQLDKDLELNGISVAEKLRNTSQDAAIIFLTSHSKVVFASFEVDTFRFLVKPLNPGELFKALDAFLKTLDTDASLMIRLDGATNVINTNRIMFIEGDGKYCVIHLNQQVAPIECRETLASIAQRLPEHLFCRCHRSFIVNLKYIHAYNHQEIKLRNGACIYISRNKYRLFEDMFIEYSRKYGY
jgi:Response regulator of the LytR/AlgR family